jgi:hypothetical protein
MDIQMIEISVLGILLILHGVMDQEIESARIRIPLHSCKELLFEEDQDGLHRFTEGIQETPCSLAIGYGLVWWFVCYGFFFTHAQAASLGCDLAHRLPFPIV